MKLDKIGNKADKPQALTDAGVGRALFTTRFRLSLQAGLMCLVVGALPGFAAPYLAWYGLSSGQNVDLVRLNLLANMVSDTTPRKWRIRDDYGERSIVEFETEEGRFIQWMTPPQVRKVLGPLLPRALSRFNLVAWSSLLTAGLGFYLTLQYLARLGAGSQQNQRVRGASLIVTGPELSALVEKKGGGPYKLADVLLPKQAPVTGILLQGSPGGGKSLATHDLMLQVFERMKKCLIYDPTGEYFKAYYRPDKDFFFNPGLEGSVPWSIFSELRYTYDADTLARAFLPPKAGVVSGAGGFFEDAARSLFSVILLRMAQRGARDTCDIAKAFLDTSDAEINLLVANSVASSAIGGDSKGQRQGVMSSIAIYLNGIAAVQRGSWSIRDFIDGPTDSRLFIVGSSDTQAQFAPLYRLLLTVAFSLIEAKAEIVHEDRYWFWLDECHTLGDIRLDEQLATLRKYGVAVVSGIQSQSQFVSSMGRDRAMTVSNCFNTVLLLRANDADMQEASARRLAKVEMDTVSRNQALAVTEWRDGAGLNKSEHEKWLVMPAEFGELDDCNGYLKLVGAYPAAKVDYSHWLKRSATGRSHLDKFKAVQPLAPKNQSFVVVRQAHNDVLGGLKAEANAAQAAKAAEAKEAATKAAASPGAPAAAALRVPGLNAQPPVLDKGKDEAAPGKVAPIRLSVVRSIKRPAEAGETDSGRQAELELGATQTQALPPDANPQAKNESEQTQAQDLGHKLEHGLDITHLGNHHDQDQGQTPER